MNGTSRLYRSTSNAMLGGVAAGIANYFNIDPNIVRIIFLALMVPTAGSFFVVYLALWLLIPTAGSTASDPNSIIHENLNDIASRARSFTGGTYPAAPNSGQNVPAAPGQPNGNPAAAPTATPNATPDANQASMQVPVPVQPNGWGRSHRQGPNPNVLIAIGIFFLLVNMGIFRAIHFGMWWPLLFIAVGIMMISRRTTV